MRHTRYQLQRAARRRALSRYLILKTAGKHFLRRYPRRPVAWPPELIRCYFAGSLLGKIIPVFISGMSKLYFYARTAHNGTVCGAIAHNAP
jgi:hypothetical protein